MHKFASRVGPFVVAALLAGTGLSLAWVAAQSMIDRRVTAQPSTSTLEIDEYGRVVSINEYLYSERNSDIDVNDGRIVFNVDPETVFGERSDDLLDLVAGGDELLRVTSDIPTMTWGSSEEHSGFGVVPFDTHPDTDTGIAQTAPNMLSFISDGEVVCAMSDNEWKAALPDICQMVEAHRNDDRCTTYTRCQ